MTKMNPTLDMGVSAILIVVFLCFVVRLRASNPTITVPPLHEPMDNDKLLRMIELTENWDGESVGAAGECGPWQMLYSTWLNYATDHNYMPFSRAAWLEPRAQCVIREHASWIRDEIEKHRLPDTPYTFALFWKAGAGRVINHRCRSVDKKYAERASALYRTLK